MVRVSYGENQEVASRASGAAQIAQAMDVAQNKNLPTFVGCIMVVLHCSIVNVYHAMGRLYIYLPT